LKGHPKANRAYAWAVSIQGSDRLRFFAVLHMGPVTGPVEAVEAAAKVIRKSRTQPSGATSPPDASPNRPHRVVSRLA
jgi:hypothetical protein